MSNAPAKSILTKAETWQFRKAQSVNAALAQAILRICEANEAIRICYLLDTRKGEGNEVKLMIALSLDDEESQMDAIVIQFQEMLHEFPSAARNSAIMSADQFKRNYAGAEFYVRSQRRKRSLE